MRPRQRAISVSSGPWFPSTLERIRARPARRAAARLPRAIDGNCYWTLMPAERLEDKEPLAASLLYRRMIDFTLDHGRSKRYGQPCGRPTGRCQDAQSQERRFALPHGVVSIVLEATIDRRCALRASAACSRGYRSL
jgi:hypothetical protein